MKIKQDQFPLLIILAGILLTLFLQWQIPQDVYFSGDAGLKALLAQQLGTGNLRFDLEPPSQAWIRELWQQGFYPYQPPFVYDVADQYFITFPFTFPLITAPFFALFGYRGLYLVPLVCTWITWLVFYWLCRRWQLSNLATSMGLIGLIFASPLTLYSAMYWEHSLAVALAFSGMAVLFSREPSKLTITKALFSGLLIGVSVWFRPEFLCVAALFSLLVYLEPILQIKFLASLSQKFNLNFKYFRFKNNFFFVVSLFLTIGLFFLCNKLIYGYFLGIHAIQVVEKSDLLQKLKDTWQNFTGLSLALFAYFPVAFFPALYLILKLFTNKIKLGTKLIFTYLFCLFFIIGVSVLVPVGTAGLIAGGKQWGPRFLLILIPVVSLLAVKELSNLATLLRPTFGAVGLFFWTLLLSFGVYKNLYVGTEYLQINYQNTLPLVQFLKQDDRQTVVVSHQFVAQAIEPSTQRDKVFFRAETQSDLVDLSAALVEQGQKDFIYICYPHRPCSVAETAKQNLNFQQNDQEYQLSLDQVGNLGKYPVYEASVMPNLSS